MNTPQQPATAEPKPDNSEIATLIAENARLKAQLEPHVNPHGTFWQNVPIEYRDEAKRRFDMVGNANTFTRDQAVEAARSQYLWDAEQGLV